MIKLSKPQQEQMIMVVVGTLAASAALWYFVVTDRQAALAQSRKKTLEMHDTLSKGDDLLRRADAIAQTLQTHSNQLQQIESGLSPGKDQAYIWGITNLTGFRTNWEAQAALDTNVPANTPLNTALPRKVEISDVSQPEFSDKGLLPKFPYKWATFHIKGVAYYSDLGKFIADFENTYKYFRIQNLDLSPSAGLTAEPDKLNFTFDLVAPVQPAGTETK